MDMTAQDYKNLLTICWEQKYQPLAIDMTKDEDTGRYRLGLNSKFLPHRSPF